MTRRNDWYCAEKVARTDLRATFKEACLNIDFTNLRRPRDASMIRFIGPSYKPGIIALLAVRDGEYCADSIGFVGHSGPI
jgi:hypothetical protein